MNSKELVAKVRAKELTPKEALDQSLKHSTDIGDIPLDLTVETLHSGFSAIDENEYLVKNRGRLIVLAGLPGSGKTALAMQMAGYISEESRVLFFSFEMSKENLKERHLSVISNVPLRKLREKVYAERINGFETQQAKLNLSIIDDDGLTITDVLSKTFDEHERSPLSAVFIDYLGLFEVDDNIRYKEMGRIAEALKFKLAMRLKIPVIVLSQLNDGFSNRYNQFLLANEKAKFFDSYKPVKNMIRPLDTDLAETKRLGRAADVVMFIHRPHLFDRSIEPSKAIVYVSKNRHGSANDFELTFSGELTKFQDCGF